LNICDIYDALRSKRPYKPAFDHPTAVKIITTGDGRTQPDHFDPVVLAAFAQTHTTFQNIFDAVNSMYPSAVYSCPLGYGQQ
jgi:putative two-component system response regulator